MSAGTIETILSILVLVAYSYYILANGVEKSFRYNTEKNEKLLIPIKVFLTTAVVVILLAITIEAFKDLPMKSVYFITMMTLLLLILSKQMFAEGYKVGIEKAEILAGRILNKMKRAGDDK